MEKMKYLAYILLISTLFAGCESMEDTYSEYNTGKERYTGMCKDLKVEEGYKRLRISWINNVDILTVNVKVKWEDEAGMIDSVLLPSGTEIYETEAVLSEQNYKISVTSLDSRGKESFPIETYSKPFTDESTLVEMLSSVQKNFYFIEDQVLLTFYEAGKDIYNAEVIYSSGGEQKSLQIQPEDFEAGRLFVKGVDAETDVLIQGKMKIEECFDEIPFETYTLDRTQKNYSGGFISNMRLQWDMYEIDEAALDTLTTLYVDYNITTLEDILYLPNLKKVVLGKRRMNPSSGGITYDTNVSKVEDVEASIFALRTLHELIGLEVEIYGNQFLLRDSLDFATVFSTNPPPSPAIPDDVDEWELKHNDPKYYENEYEEDNYEIGLELLLTQSTMWSGYWKAKDSDEIITHEITYNMQEAKEIKGFQFYQSMGFYTRSSQPTTVEIYVSETGEDGEWKSAFYQPTLNVGGIEGEVTIVQMREPKTAQYIKLVVRNVPATSSNALNKLSIGTFLPLL